MQQFSVPEFKLLKSIKLSVSLFNNKNVEWLLYGEKENPLPTDSRNVVMRFDPATWKIISTTDWPLNLIPVFVTGTNRGLSTFRFNHICVFDMLAAKADKYYKVEELTSHAEGGNVKLKTLTKVCVAPDGRNIFGIDGRQLAKLTLTKDDHFIFEEFGPVAKVDSADNSKIIFGQNGKFVAFYGFDGKSFPTIIHIFPVDSLKKESGQLSLTGPRHLAIDDAWRNVYSSSGNSTKLTVSGFDGSVKAEIECGGMFNYILTVHPEGGKLLVRRDSDFAWIELSEKLKSTETAAELQVKP